MLAVLGEGMQIEETIVGWRWIDLEVASVNQDAKRRVNRQRNAIYEAVCDLDWIDRERSNREALAGFDLDQFGVVEQTMFFQLVLDIGECELGSVNRNVQLVQDRGKSANVVLVSVRENDGANVIAVLEQVADVGNDNVNAEQFGFREH